MAKPRHLFMLNPYQEHALTRCPKCQGATKIRRHRLAVHIEPGHLLFLNKTCRYCEECDLIIAKKDELEPLINAACEVHDPATVGGEYLVIGTIDREDWRRFAKEPVPARVGIRWVHPFESVLDLKVEPGGWRYDPSKDKYRASDRKSR